MESKGRIAILLATYNGEKFLDEQLRSLLQQTYRDFIVLVRDDHSSDRTPKILSRWADAAPGQIFVVSDDRGNLRSSGNFSRLMEICEAPYFAFCDQDDVWLPNKLELFIKKIQELEQEFGDTTPILVHSDLKIVDGNLNYISSSLFEYWKAKPRIDRQLNHLIFNNIVTGCALMGNKALLVRARPIPTEIFAHDWWVALVAASCGILRTINEPTILYRQHGGNQIGAGSRKGRSTLWDARHVLQQPRLLCTRLRKAMLFLQSQASILLRATGDKMPLPSRNYLLAVSLPQMPEDVVLLRWPQRTWLFVRFLIIYARALPLALRRCY